MQVLLTSEDMAVRVSGPSFLAFLTYYSLLFPFQIALPQLLEAEAAKRNPDDQVTVNITDNNLAAEERAQELANNHFSIFINQDRRPRASLPDWCKPVPNRKLGPWHLLADDEYSNESPYLLCGLPETFPRTAGLQRVSRKTAHAKGLSRSPYNGYLQPNTLSSHKSLFHQSLRNACEMRLNRFPPCNIATFAYLPAS